MNCRSSQKEREICILWLSRKTSNYSRRNYESLIGWHWHLPLTILIPTKQGLETNYMSRIKLHIEAQITWRGSNYMSRLKLHVEVQIICRGSNYTSRLKLHIKFQITCQGSNYMSRLKLCVEPYWFSSLHFNHKDRIKDIITKHSMRTICFTKRDLGWIRKNILDNKMPIVKEKSNDFVWPCTCEVIICSIA